MTRDEIKAALPGDRSLLPVISMGVTAEVSGIADGSLGSVTLYLVSVALLLVASLAMLAERRHEFPWAAHVAPMLYLVSATLLILSQHGSATGLTVILLIPVLWVAVNGSKVHSAITVGAMTTAIVTIFAVHHSHFVVTARVLVLWAALGVGASAVIHQLRRRLAASNSELARLATTDPMTGLANRRGFDQEVVARRGRRDFAVLVIDVDGLKALNDSAGHVAGDELLRAVGVALSGAARAGDVVARLGGDEFAVFIAEARPGDADAVAARLRVAVEHIEVRGRPVRVSIGSAVGGPGTVFDDLMNRADVAMYEEKRQGRQDSASIIC